MNLLVKELVKEPETKSIIRFQDCDPFGHLNNAKYIDYIFNAREDHLLKFYDLDIYKRGKNLGENWVVRSSQVSYISPAIYNDEVFIRTKLLHVTFNTILVEGLMFSREKNRVHAVLWAEFSYINLATGKPVKHDSEILNFFRSIKAVEEDVYPDDFGKRTKEIKAGKHGLFDE